jgi:hypothetical protein
MDGTFWDDGDEPLMSETPRHIRVYRGDQLVLDLWDRPGILISVSAPPPRPGQGPVTHPFASATFMTPETEGELGEALRDAETLDGFLATIRSLGYEVEVDGEVDRETQVPTDDDEAETRDEDYGADDDPPA